MEPITYSLKTNHSNSNIYYDEIESFTNEVLIKASDTLKPIAEKFMNYIQVYNLEDIRDIKEYVIELISFGVLWNKYAHKALSVKFAPFILMAKMAEWRKKHQRIKPFIDIIRGIFSTLFLLPEKSTSVKSEYASLQQIDHVCKWFDATGEFREQALRFVLWRAYWETLDKQELYYTFKSIDEFTQWFKQRSNEVLGKYTENVEEFLRKSKNTYRWREDRISCTRSRLEYHLNMVGAEIMNRAFQMDFSNTDSKAILVPGCMRTHNNGECKSIKVKEGLLCNDCVSNCRVNALRKFGIKEDFKVYIIPHASDLSLWSPKPGTPRRGVIASACVTTLVEGGWELKRYGVPAQCVLLDYSGCKKHWDSEGKTTSLNIQELKNINSKAIPEIISSN